LAKQAPPLQSIKKKLRQKDWPAIEQKLRQKDLPEGAARYRT
jgi:hypothetical protein